jgi:dihydrodipicolinate synthase/N-acetylneuraminate lyase
MKKRETPSIVPSIFRTNLMYMSLGKACMDLVGLSGGPLRLPLEELTDEEKRELEAVLKDLGIL